MKILRTTIAILTVMGTFFCSCKDQQSPKEHYQEGQEAQVATETRGDKAVEKAMSNTDHITADATPSLRKGYSEYGDKFAKELGTKGHWADITFKVWTDIEDGMNVLYIQPSGYTEANDLAVLGLDDMKAYDAEIDDLNQDGFPEVLIYTIDKENRAGVKGYASNFGKSMSEVYLGPTSENKQINAGYAGYDEFAIVEGNLHQVFPIFENGQPTGITRQVSYKMVDGEATRVLEVSRTVEY